MRKKPLIPAPRKPDFTDADRDELRCYPCVMHGGEGVKLEQMVCITANGYELISRYPFDQCLL